MAEAFAWGTLAASSLVIGAVAALRFRIGLRTIGLVMGFGAGVLTAPSPSTSSRRRPARRRGTAPS
jgi:hypothetical protein